MIARPGRIKWTVGESPWNEEIPTSPDESGDLSCATVRPSPLSLLIGSETSIMSDQMLPRER